MSVTILLSLNRFLRPGQPGNEIEEFALPQGGEPVYVKPVNSVLIGTALEADLRARAIEDLVFTGISSDHCVKTSVRMAANLGFRATIAADACYAFQRITYDGRRLDTQSIHDAHLASLRDEFARIATTDQLLLQ